MKVLNVEIKARCRDPQAIREILYAHNARYVGLDRQTDTYFNVPEGRRLKLREGNVENALIAYRREDLPGQKTSHVQLYHPSDSRSLRDALADPLGIQVVVIKEREIYFIGHVKFHIDRVEGLGTFVEIEAIDSEGMYSQEELRTHCAHYTELLGIIREDMLSHSYSDMLMAAR